MSQNFGVDHQADTAEVVVDDAERQDAIHVASRLVTHTHGDASLGHPAVQTRCKFQTRARHHAVHQVLALASIAHLRRRSVGAAICQFHIVCEAATEALKVDRTERNAAATDCRTFKEPPAELFGADEILKFFLWDMPSRAEAGSDSHLHLVENL